MNLTFTRTEYGGARGVGENGAVLFTIAPSMTSRTTVNLRTRLPGIRENITVEGPDKYDKVTFAAAMEKAARILERWAARQLGVALAVNIVDNT